MVSDSQTKGVAAITIYLPLTFPAYSNARWGLMEEMKKIILISYYTKSVFGPLDDMCNGRTNNGQLFLLIQMFQVTKENKKILSFWL